MTDVPTSTTGRRVVHPLPQENESGPATEDEIREMEREKVSPELVTLARRQADRRGRRWWRHTRGASAS
jgi:hypothetical protein